jgi:hypothetical protein
MIDDSHRVAKMALSNTGGVHNIAAIRPLTQVEVQSRDQMQAIENRWRRHRSDDEISANAEFSGIEE